MARSRRVAGAIPAKLAPPPRDPAAVRWLASHERALLALLLLAGLAWRIGILLEVRGSPYADLLTVDGRWHHERALRVAGGAWSEGDAFFRAPLYYYALGAVYAVCGAAVRVAQWWQVVLSAATLAAVALTARRLSGPPVAVVATLAAAFYGMFAYFAVAELVTVTLTLLLNTLGLWRLLVAAESGRPRNWLQAGLLFGLSAITRPDVLVFAALVPAWIAWHRRAGGARGALRAAAAFALGCALPILPATAHNYAKSGDLVLVASQGGINFFIGNNAEADGVSAVVPEIERRHGDFEEHVAIARHALADPRASASAVSRYWFRRGTAWITGNFGDWLRLTARKAYLYWNAHEIGNNRVVHFVTDHSVLATRLAFTFWMICPLAAVGAWRLRREPAAALLLLYVAAYFAATVLYFVNARFRMPIVPALIALAAHALVDAVRRAGSRPRSLAAAAVVALAVATAIRPYPPLRSEDADGHYQDGLTFARQGRHEEGLRHLRKARDLKPHSVANHLALGRVYLEGFGDLASSVRSFEAAIALAPDDPVPVHDLGVAYLGAGRYAEAEAQFRRALEIDGGYVKAIDNLAYCHERQGRYEDAIAEYRRLAAAAPRPGLSAKIDELRVRAARGLR